MNYLPLCRAMQDFADLNIMCIGDIFVDKYMFGTLNSLKDTSYMKETNTDLFCGAAANVAVNLSKLGCGSVYILGVVGEDVEGDIVGSMEGDTEGDNVGDIQNVLRT